MLAKILVLVAIFGALYLFTKRHQIIAKFVDQQNGSKSKSQGGSKSTSDEAPDAIEELDYDPKTGHYRVKERKD